MQSLTFHTKAAVNTHEAVVHLAGPPLPPPAAGVILLCRVFNGETYVESFLRHYRQIGIRHMVFLDNGSTDATVDLLTGHEDVTLLSTRLPFKTHRLWMRRVLMECCPDNAWTLSVDMDELFDYPCSDTCTIDRLTGYLERHHYTALRAHMLDCFADAPLVRQQDEQAPLAEQFPWYELNDVQPLEDSLFPGPLPAWRGGKRTRTFGYGHFWLTKHPLLRRTGNSMVFRTNEHSAENERTADVTGVLLHYKFTAGFERVVHDALQTGKHWNESHEYAFYDQVIRTAPDTSLRTPESRLWDSPMRLVEEGFLSASSRFITYASGRDQG